MSSWASAAHAALHHLLFLSYSHVGFVNGMTLARDCEPPHLRTQPLLIIWTIYEPVIKISRTCHGLLSCSLLWTYCFPCPTMEILFKIWSHQISVLPRSILTAHKRRHRNSTITALPRKINRKGEDFSHQRDCPMRAAVSRALRRRSVPFDMQLHLFWVYGKTLIPSK